LLHQSSFYLTNSLYLNVICIFPGGGGSPGANVQENCPTYRPDYEDHKRVDHDERAEESGDMAKKSKMKALKMTRISRMITKFKISKITTKTLKIMKK